MRDKLQKSITNFFYEADKIISNYAAPTKYYEFYFKNEDSWKKSIKMINDWGYPKFEDEIFKQVKSVKEIEPCLDLLEIIFKPRTFSRGDVNDKRPFSDEETKNTNREWNSHELTRLFFRFKEKKETDSNITLESFSKAMTDFALSKEIVSHYKALLIGFRAKDLNDANFGTFKIQKLDEDEELEMINKYDEFFSNLTPFNIVQGFDGAWTYDFWITGKVKKVLNGKRSTFFEVRWDGSFSEVVKELTAIIKLLRIGTGIDLGIRNFFVKSTYPNECPIYDKWYYQKFGFGNYAVYGRNESGDSRRQFNLSRNEEFTRKHIENIISFQELYGSYKGNKLRQVDQATEYYTNAFDQNFAIYSFTSLLMAFESLLNGKENKIKLNKEERLNLLNEVAQNITKLSSNNKIKKEWNKLNQVTGITKAISIGKKIYSNETNTQKEFNSFFNPENGCYKLRNDLIHGNFNNEIEEKIVQILPQLSSYVRSLILRIIELKINGELVCDEANYYEKLEKFAS